MKKSILNIVYILSVSAIFFSCTKTLDRPPLDAISSSNIKWSASEMELYSNQFYPNFPGITPSSYYTAPFYDDNSSDNMIYGDYSSNPLLAGIITVPSSGGGWNWTNIRSVNYFLSNYSATKEPVFSTYATFVGEMYFWRAWFYFSLMKRFGDLPWYNKALSTNDSAELYAPRLPRNIIADSIIKDLDTAISYLAPYGQAQPLRINQDVALAFKSRVALYEGTWEEYHKGTPFGVVGSDYTNYFKESAAASEQLISSGHYQIPVGTNPRWDYWNLFNQTDLSTNPEIIFWKKFDISLGLSSHLQGNLGTGGNTGVSKSMVDAYLCTDGLPTSISPLYKGDDSIGSVVENRDLRLIQTVCTSGDPLVIIQGDTIMKFTLPYITQAGDAVNTTGYQLFKGYDPHDEQHINSTTASILFRYGEVLLNYAEAEEELGECTQQILDETINKLRDRVDMPHLQMNVGFTDPNWSFPELSPLMNEIRRERRVELGCEGFRFDDLMRWAATDLIQKPLLGAKYAQFVGQPFNPALANIPVNDDGYIFPYKNTPASNGWQFDPNKNYLYPLPTQELTLNANLHQNPGY